MYNTINIYIYIIKSHENNYTLENVRRLGKQKIEMYNYLKTFSESN